MPLLFCTTNQQKFHTAKLICDKERVDITQFSVEVDEVQSSDHRYILDHKVRAIYDKVKKPLVVSDDCWDIPALGGFPGAYMKQINSWFTPEDWLTLMSRHDDKRIFLVRNIAYMDESGPTFFEGRSERVFIDQPSQKDGVAILRVVAIAGDTQPVNEVWLENPEMITASSQPWGDFIDWYKSRS